MKCGGGGYGNRSFGGECDNREGDTRRTFCISKPVKTRSLLLDRVSMTCTSLDGEQFSG